MEAQPIVSQEVSKKKAWYLAHKDTPEYQEMMRESRRKYYLKNKQAEAEKALDRYYKKVAIKYLEEE
jgi:hypothetical protein